MAGTFADGRTSSVVLANSACKFVFSVRFSTAALRLSAGGSIFDR